MSKVDIDRGVAIRNHPQFGVDVYMYIDTPGVYFTAHETPLSEQIAKEAGFNVDAYRKEKTRRERFAQAKDAIEAELAGDETGPSRDILKEENGFKLVNVGHGRHNVEDPEGNVLHKEPLTKELADGLFNKLAGVVKGK